MCILRTGNAHAVNTGEELVLFRFNKLVKVDRTILLHTLKTDFEIDRKLNTKLLMRLENVQPAHDRTLVIR